MFLLKDGLTKCTKDAYLKDFSTDRSKYRDDIIKVQKILNKSIKKHFNYSHVDVQESLLVFNPQGNLVDEIKLEGDCSTQSNGDSDQLLFNFKGEKIDSQISESNSDDETPSKASRIVKSSSRSKSKKNKSE